MNVANIDMQTLRAWLLQYTNKTAVKNFMKAIGVPNITQLNHAELRDMWARIRRISTNDLCFDSSDDEGELSDNDETDSECEDVFNEEEVSDDEDEDNEEISSSDEDDNDFVPNPFDNADGI